MIIKKISVLTVVALITITALVGCGSSKGVSTTPSNTPTKKQVIKLGVTGDEHVLWDKIKVKLAKENIDLQLVNFSDYIRPNQALNDGEIDANAFQTIGYFNKFKADHKLDLTSIGNTVLAPMGIYSKTVVDIKTLKDGAKIAIPNDASNGGRALILIQEAGLIKLRDGVGITPTVKDIIENKKNLKIIELVATQIPRSIQDVDIAAINNGVAVDAGYSPLKDSIYTEDVKKESVKNYFNIIAVKTKDKDNETLKKLVKAYQTDETKKVIQELYKGATLPAF
ncbi:MetQ/NlpA family ABC transporter substrate-binding protein [Clostridium tagluense]|uniref:MetQ/NlpA family ABC transporter substrate-binding protein n=1 Tax=Clostridium TaxID=1485 RepID=UPI0013E96FC8|nr:MULTISPECIES: MetQ/NlpA family ABC transporter substrate-binding protein [Clostridium]MBZ9622282.1 MetQ/NlpA family ABC transporter substrate-binding protein [Clostridium sp. FP2]MCB2310294.1 MetQ/NlpA family ABC transporter substrate-binding protein [Clostridium tagluense]MCB2315064.1 MetQ/NlpA family ABC transporter substrate-binding protein [Clostridium tagluense]MCB2319994.1 MetQ/NlpA family ABC transporter substrate-binding protein [Clostridium tagluense]MCB2324807.1 MetQ/NlpA family A